jgi:hypothetical protein
MDLDEGGSKGGATSTGSREIVVIVFGIRLFKDASKVEYFRENGKY